MIEKAGRALWAFSRLTRRPEEHPPPGARTPRPPCVPPGQRVYAIGDLHGRADLLCKIIRVVRADLLRSPCAGFVLVFIGDYVDRGLRSRDVVRVLAGASRWGNVVALRGNHEAVMLRFLEDPQRVADFWMRSGGAETLLSYGVDPADVLRGRGLVNAAARFRDRLPVVHREFLESLPISFTIGDYFFCHAGVRPGVPLENQTERDLLWIRRDFLEADTDFGKMVVHGHTPAKRPELRANRINIDTGAYITNRLTCLVLEGAEQRFLWA